MLIPERNHAVNSTLPPFLQGYFTFWVIISMVWGFIATVIATVLVSTVPAQASEPCCALAPCLLRTDLPYCRITSHISGRRLTCCVG